jgi:hypothetical protein
MEKDSNNNLEVIARLIDDMYQKYGGIAFGNQPNSG